MKKTSKILSLILGAAMAMCTIPGISADADYRYYSMEDSDITGNVLSYEYFSGTELCENHKEYFPAEVVYRSLRNRTLFYGCSYIPIHCLTLKVTDDKWKEIYSKYDNKLGLTISNRHGNVHMEYKIDMSSCKSYEECQALIDEQMEVMQKKYEIIMNMCAEMYEAGYITEAKYFVREFNMYGIPMQVDHMVISDFGNVTAEEVEDVIKSVTDKMHLVHHEYDRINDDRTTEHVSFDTIEFIVPDLYSGGERTAEDYFAVLDALKEAFGDELKIPTLDTRIYTEEIPDYTTGADESPIDIIANLVKNAGIAYGDANIDNHIGIQDAVLMNKSMVGAVDFNEDQNKVTDLNGDNVVDSEDLSILLQYLVDDIDTFPVAE